MANEISFSVDWLRFTVGSVEQAFQFMASIGAEYQRDSLAMMGEEKAPKPLPFYTDCRLFDIGRVDWNLLHPENRVSVTMSGTHLATASKRGLGAAELANHVLLLGNINITRLDLACDFTGDFCDPDDFYTLYTNPEAKGHVKTVSRVASTQRGGEREGVTVYIGSRQSPRVMRVYDKGAERGTYENWTRVELEIKKPLAERALRAVLRFGAKVAFWSEFNSYLPDCTVGWIQFSFQEIGVVEVESVGRKKTSEGEGWYLRVALAAVLDRIGEGDEHTVKSVAAALAKLWGGGHSV